VTGARPLLHLAAPAGGWGSPWQQAFEVARALEPGSWTLVGGLMVQLHALLAGLPPSRPTIDVDAVLHLESGVAKYADAAAALHRLGYGLDRSAALAYRFRRGDDIVDLMVADHLGPARRPRFAGRDVFAITGGKQALKRTVDVDVETGDDTVRLSLPNLHGALVLKGAAYLSDSRDRGRHASDAVVLLACFTDPRDVLDHLAGSDRKRLLALVEALDKPEPWSAAHRDVEALARPLLADLTAGL
jgi:hypothetical protein